MRVMPEDILKMNEIYYECNNYSEVARQTGFSPSTVRKYIRKDYIPADKIQKKVFQKKDLPEHLPIEPFIAVRDYGELCILSEDEKNEIRELWNEISM